MVEVRPFQRHDRDQLTHLVNAHVLPVLPGVALSVNAVMSQLEHEPGEFIVDPWVEGPSDARRHRARPRGGGSSPASICIPRTRERAVPGCGRDPLVALLAQRAVLARRRCG